MSSLSNMLFQDEFGHISSRKLLFHSYTLQQSTTATTPSPSSQTHAHNNFDANVVMVLSVLVCALIFSLVVNSLIRCVLRCTRLAGSEASASLQSTSARCGIKKKVLKTFPIVNYWNGLQLPGLGNECVICLGDFSKGEQVKILPKCNHGFHARCIDKWLASHSSCPTCRQSLTDICQKILTGGSYSSTTSSQLEDQVPSNTNSTLSISPLEHEDFIRNH